eukprot:gene17640-14087_t
MAFNDGFGDDSVISWEEEKGSVPGLSIDGADLGANEDGGGGGAATAMSPTSPFSPLFSGGLRNFGCRVKATILAARNLPRPKSEARVDPYCILVAGSQQCATTVVDNTTEPFWNEQLRLNLPVDENPEYATLEVWDAEHLERK